MAKDFLARVAIERQIRKGKRGKKKTCSRKIDFTPSTTANINQWLHLSIVRGPTPNSVPTNRPTFAVPQFVTTNDFVEYRRRLQFLFSEQREPPPRIITIPGSWRASNRILRLFRNDSTFSRTVRIRIASSIWEIRWMWIRETLVQRRLRKSRRFLKNYNIAFVIYV